MKEEQTNLEIIKEHIDMLDCGDIKTEHSRFCFFVMNDFNLSDLYFFKTVTLHKTENNFWYLESIK